MTQSSRLSPRIVSSIVPALSRDNPRDKARDNPWRSSGDNLNQQSRYCFETMLETEHYEMRHSTDLTRVLHICVIASTHICSTILPFRQGGVLVERSSGCHEGKRKEAKAGTCLRVDCFVATNVAFTGTFGLIHSLFVPSLH